MSTLPDRALTAALSVPVSEVKAELFKALAHPARVRVLEVLSDGEHSVGEMQPLVGIESSHLSQQLGVLRRAGLVTTRKEGASVIYALGRPAAGRPAGRGEAAADLLARPERGAAGRPARRQHER